MMKRLKICCFLGLALLLLTLPVRGAELPPEVEQALPREAGQLLKDVDHWDVNSFPEGLCAIWNHLRKDVNTVLRRQTRGAVSVLLVAVLVFDRHYLGVATLINLFLTGYIVDFCEQTLHRLAGEPSMAGRIVYLIAGIVLMCAASSLYFTADLGVSTYDFVALYLSKIQQKVPFRLVRILTDLVCVSVGFALGFAPGVGTLVTAFFMGPLISYFNIHLAEPMRSGRRLGGVKEKRT